MSATVSPIAVQAGLQALRLGGSAADAAATVALTQIATWLGSVVSYAGILSLLYYEAATGKVRALDAGYNTYRGETDPGGIPDAEFSGLPGFDAVELDRRGEDGRKTLVPGFMAGLEAMCRRFGRLPFGALFEPAIWYARNGVTLSRILAAYFAMRRDRLARTEGGRRFLRQAGGAQPKAGDRFIQSDLAQTLEAIAAQGAGFMYRGAWANAFVETVRAAGGKAAAEDLAAYEPIWSEAASTDVFGHVVFVPGPPSRAQCQVLTGLDLAEALELDQRGPCWRDAAAFRDLARIARFVEGSPRLKPMALERLWRGGIDTSKLHGKAFARVAAPLLDSPLPPAPAREPRHSCSVVVADRNGDVAVMTHTINAVVWGGTGLVVGGVPLPDSAGFQQDYLATLTPGARVANDIACTLSLRDGMPVLASAPIGSSLVPETLKTLVAMLGQGARPDEAAAAPPMLVDFAGGDLAARIGEVVHVPAGAYPEAFLAELRGAGLIVDEKLAQDCLAMRGTLALAALDPAQGLASAPEAPKVMVFTGAL